MNRHPAGLRPTACGTPCHPPAPRSPRCPRNTTRRVGGATIQGSPHTPRACRVSGVSGVYGSGLWVNREDVPVGDHGSGSQIQAVLQGGADDMGGVRMEGRGGRGGGQEQRVLSRWTEEQGRVHKLGTWQYYPSPTPDSKLNPWPKNPKLRCVL